MRLIIDLPCQILKPRLKKNLYLFLGKLVIPGMMPSLGIEFHLGKNQGG
jgi:hypothetical protein